MAEARTAMAATDRATRRWIRQHALFVVLMGTTGLACTGGSSLDSEPGAPRNHAAAEQEDLGLHGDGGTRFYDGGPVFADGGPVFADGGAVFADGGHRVADGGTAIADGGARHHDGGVTFTDGGPALSASGGEVDCVTACDNAEALACTESAHHEEPGDCIEKCSMLSDEGRLCIQYAESCEAIEECVAAERG